MGTLFLDTPIHLSGLSRLSDDDRLRLDDRALGGRLFCLASFAVVRVFMAVDCRPLLVWLAAWMTGASFRRFFGVMQYRQSAIKGWRKVGRVLLYGVCAPALSYTIAALGADVAHAIPKPVEGDWKIAVGIAGTIIAIAVLSSAISKLRRTEIYQ